MAGLTVDPNTHMLYQVLLSYELVTLLSLVIQDIISAGLGLGLGLG